jgi:hypothetical protein
VWRRRGSEEGEAGRRVQQGRKTKPRRRGADLRIPDGRFAKNQTPECGVKFHARISSSTVGPRKSPRNVKVSRDVDRPVPIKAKVIEKNLVFGKPARRFRQNVFFCSDLSYRSTGDLVCKRPSER